MSGPEAPLEPSAAERATARAAKNTASRAAGEILGKLASLVLFAVLAREVGQSGLGVFVLAFAFVQIATLPPGLGLDRFLLRRLAADRDRMQELFDVVAIKVALFVPVVALAFAVASLLGYDAETRATIYVLTPGLLLDSLLRTFQSVFNARERGELLAVTLVVQRVSAAALGLAALAAGYGVVAVAITYTAGTAIGFVLAVVLLRRWIGLPPLALARGTWRSLVGRSLPFGAQDALAVLLAKLDAVLLSLLATEAAVGRYGAAYRLLESTFFLSWSVTGAFAAMFTYLGHDTEPTVRAVFQRSVKLVLTMLVPCALAFGLLAEPAMRLFFGDGFADAAEPLRLLAPVMVLIGVVYLSASLIVSRRSAMAMVAIIGGAVAVNVVLNVLLIPSEADVGAALAMLVTEALAVAAVLVVAVRTVGAIDWSSVLTAPFLAGAAMAAPLALLADVPLAALAAGVLAYAAAYLALERLLHPDDLRFVATMVRRRLPARAAG